MEWELAEKHRGKTTEQSREAQGIPNPKDIKWCLVLPLSTKMMPEEVISEAKVGRRSILELRAGSTTIKNQCPRPPFPMTPRTQTRSTQMIEIIEARHLTLFLTTQILIRIMTMLLNTLAILSLASNSTSKLRSQLFKSRKNTARSISHRSMEDIWNPMPSQIHSRRPPASQHTDTLKMLI